MNKNLIKFINMICHLLSEKLYLPYKMRNRCVYFTKSDIFSYIQYLYNKYIYRRKGEKKLNVEKRIRMCLLIERLNEHRELSEKLGIENVSKMHGKKIHNGGERIC